jgi:hypothetical protein
MRIRYYTGKNGKSRTTAVKAVPAEVRDVSALHVLEVLKDLASDIIEREDIDGKVSDAIDDIDLSDKIRDALGDMDLIEFIDIHELKDIMTSHVEVVLENKVAEEVGRRISDEVREFLRHDTEELFGRAIRKNVNKGLWSSSLALTSIKLLTKGL